MTKALKWLVIILIGGFIALLALGLAIEANKTPEERAAGAARRAAEEKERTAAEQRERLAALAKSKEAPQADQLRVENSQPEPAEESDNARSQDQEQEKGRVESLGDRLKSMAADAEWQFTTRESPIDGRIYETAKTFGSDEYEAEMSVQLKCVQARKLLSITFESHVYDSDGNALPSSAFENISGSGQVLATQGRVKWASRQPDDFIARLDDYNNVATLNVNYVVAIAGGGGISPSTALASLLPAYFELSNGAGEFTLSIPSGNSSINKVLSACE